MRSRRPERSLLAALLLGVALGGASGPAIAQMRPATPADAGPATAAPTSPPAPVPPTSTQPRGATPTDQKAATEPASPEPPPKEGGELPLTGPAFKLADEAYIALYQKDYRTAISKLDEALRQRPDSDRLKVLMVNALEQSGNPTEAERRASQYIAAGSTDAALVAERDRLRRRLRDQAVARAQMEVLKSPDNAAARDRLARLINSPESTPQAAAPAPDPGYVAAEAGFRALSRKDYETAAERAATAVRQQPNNKAYRLLLVNALAGAGRLPEAEAAATEALARDPNDWQMLAERANVRMSLDKPAEAAEDDEAALKAGVPQSKERDVRLALAEAAAKAKQPQKVLDALAPYAEERSYAIQARRGYAYLALGQNQEALACFDTSIAAAAPGKERDTALSTKIGVLADMGRKQEALELYKQSLASGDFATLSNIELAYLAVRVGDDTAAEQRFATARDDGTLTPAAALDAAYTARRLARNEESIAYFKTVVDAVNAGTLPMGKQQLFDVRRTVAEMERRWGAFATLTYNAIGVAPASLNAPQQSPGNVLQSGFEAYYRPPVIGYRDGRIFEVFVRSFMTLTNETGGATGPSTTQGVAGARYKPFSDVNLVLETAGLFAIGAYGRNDFMLRAYASQGQGTDLRVEDPSWWYWQIYGDYAHFFVTPQNLALFEARFGRSFRLDQVSDRLVLTPFAAIGGAYDDTLSTPGALGIGPGLGFRYWFREDAYTAPRSFVDMNVQYRVRLAGDNRAGGIYAGLTLAY